MASASSHRFWRLRFTASSDSGWESYVRGLEFRMLPGHERARVLHCFSLVPGEGGNRDASRAFEHSASSTGGYRTAMAPGMVGDFVAVEYTEAVEVTGVAFSHHGGAGNSIKGVSLEWSDDGEAWVASLRADVSNATFDSGSLRVQSLGVADSSGSAPHPLDTAPSSYALAVGHARRRGELTDVALRGMAKLSAAAHIAPARSSSLVLPPPPWAAAGCSGLSAALWRGQGVIVERRDASYVPNICCPGPVTVYASPRVALVVSDATRVRAAVGDTCPLRDLLSACPLPLLLQDELGDLGDLAALHWVLDSLERALAAFDATIGKSPRLEAPVCVPSVAFTAAAAAGAAPVLGKPRMCVPYEVAFLDGASRGGTSALC